MDQAAARIPVIAALAPIGGFVAYLLAESLESKSELSELITPVGLLITFLVWFSATGVALFAGLFLHVLMRKHSLPSVVILLLFCSIAALLSWPISQGPGHNPYLMVLGVGTGFTA